MEPTSAEFIRWSAPHIGALIVILLCAAVVLTLGLRADARGRQRVCNALAIVLAAEFVGEHILRMCLDSYGPWQENLPLHFCSIMILISALALWRRPRWACAFVYFGVLAASIQALITPALVKPYPSVGYFVFFLSHGLLLVAALTIPIVQKWRARRRDIVRSVLLGDVYILCAIPVNLWLGTNYGFTQHSPAEGSMLDYLGPGPWYYLWLQIPALLLFALMSLPVRERRREHSQECSLPAEAK